MTTSRKIILGAAGAAIALFALWFLLLWGPQGGKLADAEEAEQASAATNAELVLRRDRLKAAQADAPALQAKVETLRTAVPDDPKLAEFILEANDAASAAGVDFLSINPTPPAPSLDPAAPSDVMLSLTVDGGYFQVIDYLNRLSDLNRVVVVDTLGLTPTSSVGEPLSISVALSARMFTTAVPAPVPGEAPVTASPASTEATTTTTAPEATS